jgi:quinol monooxygenase YgiN
VVIVGGTFEVEAEQRDEFIAVRHELMRKSRAENGCLEYTFSADPLDPTRVLLFERWETQEALDAHLSGMRSGAPDPSAAVAAKTASVHFYDATEKPRPGS